MGKEDIDCGIEEKDGTIVIDCKDDKGEKLEVPILDVKETTDLDLKDLKFDISLAPDIIKMLESDEEEEK